MRGNGDVHLVQPAMQARGEHEILVISDGIPDDQHLIDIIQNLGSAIQQTIKSRTESTHSGELEQLGKDPAALISPASRRVACAFVSAVVCSHASINRREYRLISLGTTCYNAMTATCRAPRFPD